MRVLFVQKEGGIFGAESYQLKTIPALVSKGIDLEFLRLYTDYQGGINGDFVELLKEMGVKVHQVNIGKYPSLSVLKNIHRMVKRGGYDLIHTHLIHADFYLALAKMLFRGNYTMVSTKHGYDNHFTSKFGFDISKQRKTLYFLISRWAEKRMKASFTISNGLRNFFIGTGLSSSGKMSLIHYGFDMPEHHERKGEFKFRVAPKQIIIAGRLVAFKGHIYLLEAMKHLVRAYGKDVMLLVAGTGKLEGSLKEYVSKNSLENNVTFLGYTKEVGAYMANSDVVVIPSISEGFGVVFLEAFAAKTPVVAWNVPAANELIEDGVSGFLVTPYNINKLSEVLIDALSSKSDSITNAAYKSLKDYYCLKRMINQTLDFYETALNN